MAAGESTVVVATFSIPTTFDPQTLSILSGFIQIDSSSGERLHSSYLGVASALRDTRVIDNTNQYDTNMTIRLIDQYGRTLTDGAGFNWDASNFPRISYR